MTLSTLKKFINFLGRRNFILLALCSVIGVGWFATETAFVYIIQFFLASIGLVDAAKLGWHAQLLTFKTASLLLLGFAVVRFLVTAARTFFSIYVQQSFVFKMRTRLFDTAIRGEILLSSHEVVGLFSEITNNSGMLMYYLSMCIVDVIAVIFFIAGGLYLAPFEMAIGLLVLGLIVWPLKSGAVKIGEIGQQIQTEWDRINSQLSAAIKNKFLIKLYRIEDGEAQRGEKALRRYLAHQTDFAFFNSLLSAIPVLLGIAAIIIICYFSQRYSHTSPANLVAFLYIYMRLAQVGSESNGLIGSIRFYLPSLKALYHWINAHEQQRATVIESGSTIQRINDIELQSLGFGFSTRQIFNDLQLKVSRGERLTIMGPSGCGKSTLLALMTGILEPSSGAVKVNGQNINSLDSIWRKRIAYVGPDAFVVDGTIKENLLFGNDSVRNDNEILAALAVVNLKSLVEELPGELNFHLRNAARLSSGQLQRLSIARALLRDFDVLLFDEGTANLDSATAKLIIERIGEMVSDKIFIRVTHQQFEVGSEKLLKLGAL